MSGWLLQMHLTSKLPQPPKLDDRHEDAQLGRPARFWESVVVMRPAKVMAIEARIVAWLFGSALS